MDANEFRDKILGIIFGAAIGDAIGLASEFQSPIQAAVCYGSGKPDLTCKSWSKNIFRDRHRIHWQDGDWTDDTDQMILIMKAFCEVDQQIDDNYDEIVNHFANHLLNWAHRGFADLGDVGGAGIGQTLTKTLIHSEFLTNPHVAAKLVYDESGGRAAANGAVMRTAVTGIPFYYDLEKTAQFTVAICKITHADPRCYTSTVAIAITVALILQGYTDIEFLKNSAFAYALNFAPELSHDELKKYIFCDNIKDLDLSESNSIGYTFKAMGCGFIAMKYNSFEDAIIKITMEAGDADTNCAVAGGIIGGLYGYSNLPKNWISSLLHHDWLLNLGNDFVDSVNADILNRKNNI